MCDLPVGNWSVGIGAASSGSQDISSGGCLAVTCMLVMSFSTYLHCIPADRDSDYHDSRLLRSARPHRSMSQRQLKRMVEVWSAECRTTNLNSVCTVSNTGHS